MNNIIKYVIDEKGNEVKLKNYLKEELNLSTRFSRASAREKNIRVNGKIAKLSYILNKDDVLEINLSKKESQNIEPEKMPLDIVYEDSDIIVVNKSPNMVVHPTKRYSNGTLSNGVLYYFKETNQKCIVRLVSRLDMDTSGLIIIAKNQFSHMALSRDAKDRKQDFKKAYLAIIHGKMKEDKGTIDLPIYRVEDSIKRVIDERGKKSITHYEVIENYKEAQLLKLVLETGRTHQIRVHLSSFGNPIWGDSLYGKEEENYIKRQALHAYKLSFPHPRTGKIIELETELPEDMKKLAEKLKKA